MLPLGLGGTSPVQAAPVTPDGSSSPASRASALTSSSAGVWNQLTPTAMGNIAQFGWSSGCFRRTAGDDVSADNNDDIGGGGGVINDGIHGSTSNSSNSNTASQRSAAAAAATGATAHAAAAAAAPGGDREQQVEHHRPRSASKLPVHPNDAAPGAAAATVAAPRDGPAGREASGGTLTGGERRPGWVSPPRVASPDGRTQSPVPVRAGLPPNLHIDVDQGGGGPELGFGGVGAPGGDGGGFPCESQSTPGM